MKLRLLAPVALAVAVSIPAFAQRPEEKGGQQRGGEQGQQRDAHTPRANQGRVPPPPAKRDNPRAKPEPERHDGGRVNSVPHVSNDHWYGHDSPNDKRYHIDHPFEHGHFEHFGPSYRYRIDRFDPDHHRFWFPGGFYFQIADWDWSVAADWCWNCNDDDFVVYQDSDHDGWYMLYNVHTGQYIHVQYMGS
jgi:hypothetical protein